VFLVGYQQAAAKELDARLTQCQVALEIGRFQPTPAHESWCTQAIPCRSQQEVAEMRCGWCESASRPR